MTHVQIAYLWLGCLLFVAAVLCLMSWQDRRRATALEDERLDVGMDLLRGTPPAQDLADPPPVYGRHSDRQRHMLAELARPAWAIAPTEELPVVALLPVPRPAPPLPRRTLVRTWQPAARWMTWTLEEIAT